MIRISLVVIAVLFFSSCAAQRVDPPAAWRELVSVPGQPEPIPAYWVSTPEGKFAHSLVIPNPVPRDSGYRHTMSGREYFEHLCSTQAGEFVYRTVSDVEGFLFLRPPERPTDSQLTSRHVLEAPELVRFFSLFRPTPEDRSGHFVAKDFRFYRYVEEPVLGQPGRYVKAFGSKLGGARQPATQSNEVTSRFGVTWRGLRHSHDRELGISGGEWIVLDLTRNEILAVKRSFGYSTSSRAKEGVWWLNAVACPATNGRQPRDLVDQLYGFLTRVIRPVEAR